MVIIHYGGRASSEARGHLSERAQRSNDASKRSCELSYELLRHFSFANKTKYFCIVPFRCRHWIEFLNSLLATVINNL
jgi:hypothetical protein